MNLGCIEIIDNVLCGFRLHEAPCTEEHLIEVDFDNLVLPDGVTEIRDNAFMNCENLIKITFPDSLTKIGSSAFQGCKNLVSCGSLRNVESVGEWMFFGCDKLISPKANYKSFYLKENKMCSGNRLFEENKWSNEVLNTDIQKEGYFYYTNLFEVFNHCYGIIGKDFVIYECEVGDFTIGLDFGDSVEPSSSKRMTTKIKPINKLTKKDIVNKLHSINGTSMYDELTGKLTIG